MERAEVLRAAAGLTSRPPSPANCSTSTTCASSPSCEWQALGQLREDDGAIDRYLDELAEAYDFDALRRFRVVVDCCNGTSSLILRRMNERYGLRFILINERMEGVAVCARARDQRAAWSRCSWRR